VDKGYVGASEQHMDRYIHVLVNKIVAVQSIMTYVAILCVVLMIWHWPLLIELALCMFILIHHYSFIGARWFRPPPPPRQSRTCQILN
jgi:hypothetical protein